jgi:hypothetical protein
MLKQIGIRLEEELIAEVKMYAFRNSKSLQEVVADALKIHMNHTPPIKVAEMVQPLVPKTVEEPVKPPVNVEPKEETDLDAFFASQEPDPMDERYFYVLRKTAKLGKRVSGSQQYNNGGIFWMILDGCRAHFDKDGNVIPFRFTDADGKVLEPDADEIKELEEYYGKPVTIEK